MRVIYDFQIFNLQERGGISRYILETAGRMEKIDGVDSKIFAFAHINLSLASDRTVTCVGQLVKTRYLPTRLRELTNRALTNRAIREYKPEIIHETYYSEHSYSPGSTKTVVTVHDMIHEKVLRKSVGSQHLIDAKRAAVLRADHIICVSNNTKKDLLNIIPISEEKVSVVHLGSSFTAANQQTADDRSASTEEKPYLLYVGHRSDYKNFSGLLRAFSQSTLLFSNFNLLCFGSRPFGTDEIAAIHAAGLSEETVRHISGDDSALVQAYRAAALFVYPSLYEGFGLPPLEAMSCGCPVVWFRVGSIPEVVGDAAAFCDHETAESLQTTIESVVFNEAVKERLVVLGYQRVSHFSWDRCARETSQVYQKIVN